MTTQDLTLMSAMLKKMDWLEERQKVIAQNIANADTPGYRPLEVKPLDFKELLGGTASKLSLSVGSAEAGSSPLAMTQPDHLEADTIGAPEQKVPTGKEKHPYEVAPAGNAVILEEQLLKMNENYTDHAFVSNLYQRNVNLIKASLK